METVKSKRGGKRPGAGRPRGAKSVNKPDHLKRSVMFFGVRFTRREAKKIELRIKASGLSASEWIRGKLLR